VVNVDRGYRSLRLLNLRLISLHRSAVPTKNVFLYNGTDFTMKTFHSIRSLVFLVSFAALGLTAPAQTPTAKSVFDAMIQALGGKAFLDVKEAQFSGRFFQFSPRGEISSSDLYAELVRFPDKRRLEFGKENQKRLEINDGEKGWIVTPPEKRNGTPDVQPQPARSTQAFLDEVETSFEYVIRFVVNTPKTTLVNAGSDLVEYKRVDVLEIRDADKNLLRIFVDRQTHLPIKVQMRRANESSILEKTWANWHKFDGVMTPLMEVQYKDGLKLMEIRIEKVAYNPGFADSLFAPPVQAAK
jgi:outer membrane lipoprotein-sorting protein